AANKRTVTPAIPFSPASRVPLLLASLNTWFPRLSVPVVPGGTTPKSRVKLVFGSLSPSVIGSPPVDKGLIPLRRLPPVPSVPFRAPLLSLSTSLFGSAATVVPALNPTSAPPDWKFAAGSWTMESPAGGAVEGWGPDASGGGGGIIVSARPRSDATVTRRE